MGRVWTARRLHSPTPQYVAVKTALEELSGDAEFERVFIDEARIASSIVHPNVCTIYELGVENQIPYLVMEWVNGGSLHDVLAASPDHRIDCYLAAGVIASVCAGLHAAHELTDLDGTPMHVVHRDVSPQNILVSEQGHVKIADFGVARAKGQLHKPTQTGELKGKLSYMAPEQLTTKSFDRRADVFALGCVLFQATTGQRPFHGNDALETMYKLLETQCELPSRLVPDYPPELEAIVLRALAKDVTERYQSAEELELALSKFLVSMGKLVTDRDVAGLVADTLGPVVLRRTEELKLALEAIELPRTTLKEGLGKDGEKPSTASEPHVRGDGSPAPRDPKSRAAKQPPSPTPTDSGRTLGGAWESARPDKTANGQKPRWRRYGWPLAAIGAIGVAGSLAALYFTSSGAPPTAAFEGPPALVAAPERTVQIRVRAIPADSLIALDGAAPQPSPVTLTAPASAERHRLTVSRADYETEEREVAFDNPLDLLIELHPRAATSATTTPREPPKPGRPAKSGATAIAVPSRLPAGESHKTNDPVGMKPRKPSRSLDPNNPFSDP